MLHKAKQIAKKIGRKSSNKIADIAQRTQTGRKMELSVSDAFFMQFDKQELRRYDVVVRYLAIENYFGKNDFGFELYRKMQDARIAPGYGESAERQFRELIGSYVSQGYDCNSCITVDKNLSLIDGSHRLALHLYMGIENIRVLVVPAAKPVDYTVDWFFQNGFTDSEIDRILAKSKELIEKANSGFSCVVWSPAANLAEMIKEDMTYFGQVMTVKRYTYSPAEYRNVVKAIYAVDDIAPWKIQKKLEHMRQEAPELYAIRFRFDYPDFRLKDATGLPLSRRGERLKKTIRARFKMRIDDYYFDNILHMADNHQQSAYMFKVLEPGIDLMDVLSALAPYTYALAKTDSPYYPKDFPHHVPVGKDVDILCLPQQISEMVKELKAVAERWQGLEIRIVESAKGTRIRAEKCGHLILQLDVSCMLEGLDHGFVEDALRHRKQHDEYMRLSAPYEYVYRIVSYYRDTKKTWHREYLNIHRADYSAELLKKYTKLSEKDYLALLK